MATYSTLRINKYPRCQLHGVPAKRFSKISYAAGSPGLSCKKAIAIYQAMANAVMLFYLLKEYKSAIR
jgi:hypothetical protein